MEKVEKDGLVAVLYSPGYGAGWHSWNSEHEGLLFDREIVEAVLAGDVKRAVSIAEAKYPGIYTGGGDDLTIEWVPKGSRFEIHEYDGSESVRIFGPQDGHVA
jgi:hypothetical protein